MLVTPKPRQLEAFQLTNGNVLLHDTAGSREISRAEFDEFFEPVGILRRGGGRKPKRLTRVKRTKAAPARQPKASARRTPVDTPVTGDLATRRRAGADADWTLGETLWKQGRPVSEIASRLGVTPMMVYQRSSVKNWPKRQPARKATTKEPDDWMP